MSLPTLRVLGGAVISGWTEVQLVERNNKPDTWQISGSAAVLEPLMVEGARVSLATDAGRYTGTVAEVDESAEVDPSSGAYVESATVTVHGDLMEPWRRLAYPDPTRPLGAQDTARSQTLTGPVETVILALLASQAQRVTSSGGAEERPAGRWIVPASQGRGPTVTVQARFEPLGDIISDLAERAGLRVTCVDRTIAVTAPPDLTRRARYGTPNRGGPGVVSSWRVVRRAPTCTHALVGGVGDGQQRLMLSVRDPSMEALWNGWHAEQLVDAPGGDDPAALETAGMAAVADGSSPVSVSADLPDVDGMRLGVDVPLGSLVRLDLGRGAHVIERVRAVTTTWTAKGVTRSGRIGSEAGDVSRDQRDLMALRRSARKAAAR